MADDLTTMLTDGAQSEEDAQRLAGNVQDAAVVDPAASVDNPAGSTPTGFGTDNTTTESAPESQPPALDVTATIPGPETYDTGGSGSLVVPPSQPITAASTSTAPQDPVLTNLVDIGSLAEIPAVPEQLPPAPELNPLLSIDKQVVSVDPDGNGVADQVGDVITYNVVVTNSGNETLTNVVVSDPLTGLSETIASLAPGASQTFTTSYTLTQADLDSFGGGDGDIDNTATADSDQTPESNDSEAVPLSVNPLLSIDKQVVSVDPDGNQAADQVGDVITYNVVVTNSGNETLTNVVVSDPLTGLAETIASLAPGASQTFTTSYTLTQADLDSFGGGDGDIDNTATADSDQTPESNDSEAVPLSVNPLLSIDKQVVSVDPDGNQAADQVGDVITYNVVVTNSGNETLTNVVVSDPLTGLAETIASLAPGASQTFTTSYTLTQADLDSFGGGDGDIDNTATADSDQTPESNDSEAVPLSVNPLLSIDKQVVSVDPTGNQTADKAGDVITYNVVVTNSGNETLTNVVVSDPLTGLAETIASLAPGASQTFTTSYTLTQADLDSFGGGDGDIDNTATADSDQTPESNDSEAVPLSVNPLLSIDKQVVSVDPTGNQIADKAGDVITYNVVVTNSGNETLTNVVVSDPLTGLAETIASLAPGASQTFTTSYTLTQADLDSFGGGDGDIDNTATADSDQTPESNDSEAVPLSVNPLLSIDKQVVSVDPTGNQIADKAGDVITYNVVVTNSGNETLTNVVVSDPLTGLSETIASLAPGASQTFTTSYTLTQADLDSFGGGDGDIDNTATADSDQTPESNDSEAVPLSVNPLLSIDKQVVSVDPDGNQAADQVGDVITYNVVVTNSGNETLTNVVVSDPLTGLAETIASLAPGASQTFTTSYTLTQADLDSFGGGDGDIDNTATADSDQTPESNDSEAVPLSVNPLLSIDKQVVSVDPTGNQIADKAGDVITYNVVVTNSGNETLTNVVVSDPLTGLAETIASLAPGASQTFTTSYTLTQADLDSFGGGDGDIDNTATADSDQTTPRIDTVDVPIFVNPDLLIVKTATAINGTSIAAGSTGEVTAAGQVITYTITVQNTGNQSLTGVTVTDPLADPGSIQKVSGDQTNPGVLDVGETWTYTATHTVTQAEIDRGGNYDSSDVDTIFDQLLNVATADSDQTAPETDDAVVNIDQNPDLLIVKTATAINGTSIAVGSIGEVTAAGQVITYTITVQNTGNQSLTGVTVTDPLADPGSIQKVSGDQTNPGVLDVGETWTYTATHTVTQAEIDRGGNYDSSDVDTIFDQLLNVATADSDQTAPETDDAVVNIDQNPDLLIVKTATAINGTSIAAGSTGEVTAAGQVITYTITVQNTGNQSLTGVTVTDPLADPGSIQKVSGDQTNPGVLDVGETWTYTATHTVTQAEIDRGGNYDSSDVDTIFDQLLNVATADSDQTAPETDDAVVNIDQNPDLLIVKTATAINGTSIAVGSIGEVTAAGQVITYTITVQNTGNQSLTGVTVTDPLADPGSIQKVSGDQTNPGVLDVGETWTYTATHTVTQAEIDRGGNYDSSDVDTIFDQLLNVATADSDQTAPETDDAVVNIDQNPDLLIVKTATAINGTSITAGSTGEVTAAGQVITYTITVQNTGNQILTGVTVTDPLADPGSIQKVSGDQTNPGVLDVGETWTYTATHTVTQAEIDRGGNYDSSDVDTIFDQLLNVATADSDQTAPETDDAVVNIDQNPDLLIVKTATAINGTSIAAGSTGEVTAAGQVITYTITVQNTGNQSLTGVTVTDPLADPGSIQKVSGDQTNPGVLDVGETWTYTATHTVTQAEIDRGGNYDSSDVDTIFDQLLNVATADSDQTAPETDDAVVNIDQNPDLLIVKTATAINGTSIAAGSTGEVTAAGQVITYTITVQNTGNQSLTGVTVTDPLADPGSIQKVSGDQTNPGVLDVGETWTYTATHTVTQAEIDRGGNYDSSDVDTIFDQLLNVATADSDQTAPETDDAVVNIDQNPDLLIVKTATAINGTSIAAGSTGEVTAAGQVITYTITVQNTGNQSLTGVTVTDPLADPGSIQYVSGDQTNPGVLDVGETWTYTATHTVTQAEIDNTDPDISLPLTNVATADSNQTQPESDDAVVDVIGSVLVSTAFVDDEGLQGGIANGPFDIAPPITQVANNETTYQGSVNVTAVDGVLSFASLSGSEVLVGTETVKLAWADGVDGKGTLTGTTTRGGSAIPLFKIDVDGLGYKVTLLDNVLHESPVSLSSDDNNEKSTLLSLDYVVSAGLGGDRFGTLQIALNDDVPIWTSSVASNNATSTSRGDGIDADKMDVFGLLPVSIGADAVGTASFLEWINDPLGSVHFKGALQSAGEWKYILTDYTSGGEQVYYAVNAQNPGTILATTDVANFANQAKWVLTITADIAGGKYLVDVIRDIDTIQSFNFTTFEGKGGTGPDGSTYLVYPGSITGVPGADPVIVNFYASTGNSVQTSNAQSTYKVGVNNQWVGDKAVSGGSPETLTIDVGVKGDNSVAYVASNPSFTSNFTVYIEFQSNVITGPIDYRVTLLDGSTIAGTESVVNGIFQLTKAELDSLHPNPDPSLYAIKSVELLPVSGYEFRVGGVGLSTDTVDIPVTDTYSIVVRDADGDYVRDSFAVTYDPSVSIVAPIVLDLNLNSALDLVSAVEAPGYDMTGDGVVDETAWISEGDAFLVFDTNANHIVDSVSELTFTQYLPGSETDLEGLASFDLNSDRVIDSADSIYAMLGVWSDVNMNGLSDSGEFRTLEDAGVAFVSLDVQDGSSGSLLDGSLLVHGVVSFSLDGILSGAYDSSFVVSSTQPQPPTAEMSSVSELTLSQSEVPSFTSHLDVQSLVSSYLDTVSSAVDSDVDAGCETSPGTGELAYHLDTMISDFIDNQGLSDVDYARIHQEVLDHLAHELNDVIPGTHADIIFNDNGHVVDDAQVLAALDQNLQNLLDHLNGPGDGVYHDVAGVDHTI